MHWVREQDGADLYHRLFDGEQPVLMFIDQRTQGPHYSLAWHTQVTPEQGWQAVNEALEACGGTEQYVQLHLMGPKPAGLFREPTAGEGFFYRADFEYGRIITVDRNEICLSARNDDLYDLFTKLHETSRRNAPQTRELRVEDFAEIKRLCAAYANGCSAGSCDLE